MSKIVKIHSCFYSVNEDEFSSAATPALYPLEPVANLSLLDREIGFLKRLSKIIPYGFTNKGTAFGGYVPLNVAYQFEDIQILPSLTENVVKNMKMNELTERILCITEEDSEHKERVLRVDVGEEDKELSGFSVAISDDQGAVYGYRRLYWYLNRCVYVHTSMWESFYRLFKNHIQGDRITFDNLINLLIMVKNAGDGFRDVLQANLPYIDRYTILDTGSTDNTVAIIKEVLKDKDGDLYEEPFLNFRDSRNRLLDLAGEHCAFNIMLDDTYILTGDLRSFLETARSDEKVDSYSIYIQDIDTCYSSNRVTKPSRKLRYRYRIHEIIQENYNACIPYTVAKITDVVSKYMETRTKTRKVNDLKILFEELEENPADTRSLYYLGETFLNLEDYPSAYKYYSLRASKNEKGFHEEVQDSLYKMAVLGYYNLNYGFERCHQLFLTCYEYDTAKPEAMFMMGKLCNERGHKNMAFLYLKRAFEIGIPSANMNNRVSIYNRHLPNELISLCYEFDDYQLGLECAKRLSVDGSQTLLVQNWQTLFNSLISSAKYRRPEPKVNHPNRVCFLMDGGWKNWTGKTLRDEGLGGSETFIVRFAEYMALEMRYEVMVFCKTEGETVYNGVQYVPIQRYIEFISSHSVKAVLINRYCEYTAVSVKNSIPTYVIFHDLLRDSEIIPNSPFLKGLLGISDWHKGYIEGCFPMYKNIIRSITYGINVDEFPVAPKRPRSFIYSSFPNRGLLPLLRIFPLITARYPDATLDVFCDLNHTWTVENFGPELREIERLLGEQSNVRNHGWVNMETLRRHWATAEVWLYPCKFTETACLTAFEAAASKTLVITNHLGALVDSVGDRGVIIQGDATTEEWMRVAVEKVCDVFSGRLNPRILIERNYEWAKTKAYKNVVPAFVQTFL